MSEQKGSVQAYITLLINDSYLPGALLLAKILKEKFQTKRKLLILTAGVSSEAVNFLVESYDEIIPIDADLLSDTNDSTLENLKLLDRLDLDLSFNKLHIFNQTQYKKLVYLDLDILPLKPLDDLFEVELKGNEIAASPDAGWPDIFNSGLLVFHPSQKLFSELSGKLTSPETDTTISFDGADQGLLNQFFKGKWVRLPFSYNVTFSNHYEYLPALNFFMKEIRSFHFIGSSKPWSSFEFSKFNQLWWDEFNSFFNEEQKRQIVSLSRSGKQQGEAENLVIPDLINSWNRLTTHEDLAAELNNKLEDIKDDSDNAKTEIEDAITQVFPWESYRNEPTRVFPKSDSPYF
ncbi:hypothetical protein WICPIJ_009407 [Wickerhamomyces pijperi]|uniref:glycogenin glucosyltransferase n=1 Tax=Wickerhamomyces pijperi TaxID=599730 RepID=A0A9P8PN60_WICPI|nr:hypothetical protein WICPIJ_009407 [Wickerhamomyces pijperi]